MEIRSGVKALNYIRKLLLGETDSILPYPVKIQKPQKGDKMPVQLPRSTPEKEGLASSDADMLYRTLSVTPYGNIHACLVLRHGKVIADGYYAPYSPADWHVTHSLCKSFVGTAIGMAVDEGILSVDETAASIFPEKCNLLTGRRSKSITIQHLLTMRSGVLFNEVGSVLETDWVKAFFDADVAFEPGTKFDYNSMNSYMLAAILHRKTGVSVMNFLKPRLFDPLGFGDVAWETCPMGIEKGGWGLYLHLEDAAKLGQLYLQNGKWSVGGHEKQILSKTWICAATTVYAVSESGEEYGYQLWPSTASGGYTFNGMFGQYIMVFPEKDMVIAINAGAANLFPASVTESAIKTFVQKAVDEALPQDDSAEKKLKFTLSHLTFGESVPQMPAPPKWYQKIWDAFAFRPAKPKGPILPLQTTQLDGKRYTFAANRCGLLPVIIACMEDWYPKGITSLSFACENDVFYASFEVSGETHRFAIGFDTFLPGKIDGGGNVFKIAARGKFTCDEDEHMVLKIMMCCLESSSTRLIKVVFLNAGEILLKLDEAPDVISIVHLLESQAIKVPANALELFRDLDYFRYRVDKLCSPVLPGTEAAKTAE